MAKAYWVVTYRSAGKPDKLAAYAKLAGPAIQAAGGKMIVRNDPAQTWELGIKARVVLIEFESVEKAIAAHDSAAYQEALKALGDGAERDMRVVEALA
jgi:uncharacterized protein (DUF1330 family)